MRRLRPQRLVARPLTRRAGADLPLAREAEPGRELLLDTCVYLDVLQGRTPNVVDELLTLRITNHSTVALSELTHLFGRLDPAHPETARTLRGLGGLLDDIPNHRLWAPSPCCSAEAGMLAGLAARVTSRTSDLKLLNDAALFLQARERGLAMLTANIADFDIFDQLLPGSGLLLYSKV